MHLRIKRFSLSYQTTRRLSQQRGVIQMKSNRHVVSFFQDGMFCVFQGQDGKNGSLNGKDPEMG